MDKRFSYKGAMHVHTVRSDGSGNLDEISKAAARAGLSWIIVTDHNDFDSEEGFMNGVCVIKGEEISPDNANHYLALDIKEKIEPHENPTVNVVNVIRQGGFGICAHPDESGMRKNSHKPIKWTDETVSGDGVEIWNAMSDWTDNYDEKNFLKTAAAFLFPRFFMRGAKRKTLAGWDNSNLHSRFVKPAVSGCDAHAFKIKKYIIPVTVFSYERMFRTSAVNSIILKKELPKDFEACKKAVLGAIRGANNIILNASEIKTAPEIFVESRGKRAYCGELANFSKDETYFVAEFENPVRIRLLRDGKVVLKTFGNKIRYKIEKRGKYRIEGLKWLRPVFYSNPICVF